MISLLADMIYKTPHVSQAIPNYECTYLYHTGLSSCLMICCFVLIQFFPLISTDIDYQVEKNSKYSDGAFIICKWTKRFS